MSYVEPNDIRQHLRGAGGASVPAIAELMQEVESFVKIRLDMDPLPENNDIIRDIVRELTLAKVIVDLMAPSAEDLSRAQMHRRNGMEQLEHADRHGVTPRNTGAPGGRDVSKEVYNPYPEPFFTAESFLP